jgi:hypothetical protein
VVQTLFPESDELDGGIDYVFLDTGADPEEALVLLFQAKAYQVLDAGLRWCSKDNERERVPHSLEANARAHVRMQTNVNTRLAPVVICFGEAYLKFLNPLGLVAIK